MSIQKRVVHKINWNEVLPGESLELIIFSRVFLKLKNGSLPSRDFNGKGKGASVKSFWMKIKIFPQMGE